MTGVLRTTQGQRIPGCLVLALLLPAAQAGASEADAVVARGLVLALDSGKGNCIGCHQFRGAEVMSNVGPRLEDMARRYPDRAALRAQIWDAGVRNPETLMPPFGRFGILSEDEIDALTAFLFSL